MRVHVIDKVVSVYDDLVVFNKVKPWCLKLSSGGKIIFGRYVNVKLVEEAVNNNQLEFLDKLSKLEIPFIGKYNLGVVLYEGKVSLKELMNELNRADVLEGLLMNMTIPVLNLYRAAFLIERVKKLEGNFSNFMVCIDLGWVNIIKEYNIYVTFANNIDISHKALKDKSDEVKKVLKLCKQYPLCNGLAKEGLMRWAEFLKAMGKGRIKGLKQCL